MRAPIILLSLALALMGSTIAGTVPMTDASVTFSKLSRYISQLASNYRVILIGERHRHAESANLIYELADLLTANGECITVALEITSDQSKPLDSAMNGLLPVSAVQIHPIIDSPHFRELIENIRGLVDNGRCLSAVAVDAPAGTDISRDQWIANRIGNLVSNQRVLALLGNLHAMKWTRWTNGNDDPHAAELLERQKIPVLSIMQDWLGDCESRTGRYVPIRNPTAVATVKDIISVAAVQNPPDFSLIADGVVLWRCVNA